jgi:hypothetical protein
VHGAQSQGIGQMILRQRTGIALPAAHTRQATVSRQAPAGNAPCAHPHRAAPARPDARPPSPRRATRPREWPWPAAASLRRLAEDRSPELPPPRCRRSARSHDRMCAKERCAAPENPPVSGNRRSGAIRQAGSCKRPPSQRPGYRPLVPTALMNKVAPRDEGYPALMQTLKTASSASESATNAESFRVSGLFSMECIGPSNHGAISWRIRRGDCFRSVRDTKLFVSLGRSRPNPVAGQRTKEECPDVRPTRRRRHGRLFDLRGAPTCPARSQSAAGTRDRGDSSGCGSDPRECPRPRNERKLHGAAAKLINEIIVGGNLSRRS